MLLHGILLTYFLVDWDGSGSTHFGQNSYIYVLANVTYDFDNGTSVDVSGAQLDNDLDQYWGEVGAGGLYSWGQGRYSLYGEVTAATGIENFGDSTVFGGNLNIRMSF